MLLAFFGKNAWFKLRHRTRFISIKAHVVEREYVSGNQRRASLARRFGQQTEEIEQEEERRRSRRGIDRVVAAAAPASK